MELKLCFDTTFLIDLQKERGNGRAHKFLDAHRRSEFFWSAVSVAEFAEGFAARSDPLLKQYLKFASILDVDTETALVYSELTRELRHRGQLIGANDLWIASQSLQYRLPLVTADPGHFARVPRLLLVSY